MVRHEAIGIDDAMRRQRTPLLVFRMSLKAEKLQELPIIRPLLKDILMIDTPEHNVVDARSTLFSRFSWHNFSNDGAKIRNNIQTAKKKYTKRTVPFVYCTIVPLYHLHFSFSLQQAEKSNYYIYIILL